MRNHILKYVGLSPLKCMAWHKKASILFGALIFKSLKFKYAGFTSDLSFKSLEITPGTKEK